MKQFKPLLPLGNSTVTDHVVSTFIDIGIDVFLVVGYRQKEIKENLKNRKVTIVYNPDYMNGMFSSIQAGIRQLRPEHKAFFMLPVDIPLVGADTIITILGAGVSHPENIIYPVCNSERGHPPLIPSSLAPGILKWKKDGGLKSFLEAHEKLALDIPVTDRFILFDIDTQADYRELLKQYHE
jgi:molybdenum cofactor cytidylyltransferase